MSLCVEPAWSKSATLWNAEGTACMINTLLQIRVKPGLESQILN